MQTKLNPMSLPLHGMRLIEASAGTGKTFTIATLYLRLLLGLGTRETRFLKKLTVQEILVVTFTEAATCELRERIRARIAALREALQLQQTTDIVLQQFLQEIDNYAAASELLLIAERSMDEASIYTIHGFCNRMLKQNAFESGAWFENNLEQDSSDLLQTAVNDFWRKNIYPLPASIIALVQVKVASPAKLLDLIKPYIEGHLPTIINQKSISNISDCYANWQQLVIDFKQRWLGLDLVKLELELTEDKLNKRSYSKEKIDNILNNITSWAKGDSLIFKIEIEKIGKEKLIKATKKAQTPPEHPIFIAAEELAAAQIDFNTSLLPYCIYELRAQLELEKERRQQITYTDLLTKLELALDNDNTGMLAAKIRKNYPVALIDEFQDTDPMQYKIFKHLYWKQKEQALLMIGDPKQAIYAFRGADIFTYMQARKLVDTSYNLDTNWRSSANMVAGVNYIFSNVKAPFIYNDEIPFIKVASAPDAASKHLMRDNKKQAAVTLWYNPDPDDLANTTTNLELMTNACCAEIQSLLEQSMQGSAYFIKDKLNETQKVAIKPCDIAILVRKGSQAKKIKDALAAQNIASVYLSDRSNIFTQPIAKEILLIIEALANPQQSYKIKSAIGVSLFKLTANELFSYSQDENRWQALVDEFNNYTQIWEKRGILAALSAILHTYKLVPKLMAAVNGERILTDFLHLSELLEQASVTLDSKYALVRWLTERINDPKENSQLQLRLESERNLVQIVTFHKAKGLEYNIVFMPFINDISGKNKELLSYHNEERSAVLDLDPSSENKDIMQEELLAEEIRLLYVGITRAVYACYMGAMLTTKGRSKKSIMPQTAFGYLLQEGGCKLMGKDYISFLTCDYAKQDIIKTCSYPEKLSHKYQEPIAQITSDISALSLQHSIADNWWITSYSSLVSYGHTLDASDEVLNVEIEEQSAQEILSDDLATEFSIFTFPRGAYPGTFLHTIFEKIIFNDPNSYLTVIKEQLLKANYQEVWQDVLVQLVTDVLTTPLDQKQLILANLTPNEYLAELEFMLPIHKLTPSKLASIAKKHDNLSRQAPAFSFSQVSGMVKGFIDLVFIYQGKYYILDWKSNFLGENLIDYNQGALEQAMLEHRYDLQYQLYALALQKFLKTRLENYSYQEHFGGVYYIFLRGVSPKSDSGIYATKPSEQFLDELELLLQGDDLC